MIMKRNPLTKEARLLLKACALSTALLAGTSFAADTTLLDTLFKNGVINQKQYDELLKAGSTGGDSSAALLEVLQKNGAITKDQYGSLNTQAKKAAKSKMVEVNEPGSWPYQEKTGDKWKDTTRVTIGGSGFDGLAITSGPDPKHPDFAFRFGGQVQPTSQLAMNPTSGNTTTAGVPFYNPNTQLASGLGMRRLRTDFQGTFFRDIDWRFEYDFMRGFGNTGGSTASGITYAWVRYRPVDTVNLVFGQQNAATSMESYGSNRYITFQERSLTNNAFWEAGNMNKYNMGFIVEYADKVFDMPVTLRPGIVTESIGNVNSGLAGTDSSTNPNGNNNRNNQQGHWQGNQSYAAIGRATIAPYKDKEGNLVHVGVNGYWRNINNTFNNGALTNGGWSFGAQPDTSVDRTTMITTGNLTNGAVAGGTGKSHIVQSIGYFGGELAGVWGPVHFTSEGQVAQINGTNYGSDYLWGTYAQAGWFVTGESRRYNNGTGTWDRVLPKENFLFGSGIGAIELAARFDVMNLNSNNISGGNMDAFTLGANWYMTPRLRLTTNWVHTLSINTKGTNGPNAATTTGYNTCTATGGGTTATSTGTSCYNGQSYNAWMTEVFFDF